MKDDRLISLNAAIEALNKKWRTCIIGESLIRDAGDTLKALPSAQPELSPCDVCRYYPPSSMDGKPCTICPAERKNDE